MKVCVLASGSSGNCTFVEIDGLRMLVDAGISAKRVVEGLRDIGERIEEVEGILLTHEHRDHIMGIPRLVEKFGLRLYANRATYRSLPFNLPGGAWIELPRERLEIADIEIRPFAINHDAVDPVGFRIGNAEGAVGVVTDIGSTTNLVREQLAGVKALVVEANYDPDLLRNNSRYPWDLKQRIASRLGHLSNSDCGELAITLKHDELRQVFLAHRSQENNDPQLSYDTVLQAFNVAGVDAPPVWITQQDRISDVWIG